MEKVTRYNGILENIENCRYIKGKFYKKNEDCFKVDGIWRRIDDPLMAYDFDTKSMYQKESMPSRNFYFVIAISDTGEKIYASSSNIEFPFCEVYENGKIYLIKDSIVDKNRLNYIKEYGVYSDNKTISIAKDKLFLFQRKYYSFSNVINFFNGRKFNFDDFRKSKYTFGIEVETSAGELNAEELISLGLFPLRDGSITGYEYTSVPFNDVGHAIAIAEKLSEK